MPQLPTYQARRNVTDNPGAALQEGAGAELRMVQQVAQASSAALQRWSDANDVMQATESQNKFGLLLKDIDARASADPDYKNSQVYLDEINKAKTESVKGISNQEMAKRIKLRLDYDAEITKIGISDNFKKKQLENNKVVLTQSVSNLVERKRDHKTTKAQAMQIDTDIAELLASQVAVGVITAQEANKVLFDARRSALEYDAVVNPKRVIESKAEDYGLPEDQYIKQKEVARKSLERNEKEFELEKEQNRVNNQKQLVLDLADKKVDKLSVPQVSAMMKRGEIGRDFGEAYIRVLTSPESIDPKDKIGKKGFLDYAKNIFKDDDPVAIEKALIDLMNGTADGKLTQEEMGILLKTASKEGDRGWISNFLEGAKKFGKVSVEANPGVLAYNFFKHLANGEKVPEARNKAVMESQSRNPFYSSFTDKKIGEKVVLPNGVPVIFTGHDESGDITFEIAK